jgi:L-fuculose-phosphate aldolase
MFEKFISSQHMAEFCALSPVPVLGWGVEIKAGGLSDSIAQSLVDNRIVAVHGHGCFAVGQLLDEALNFTTGLEEACQIICLMKTLSPSIPKPE